MVRKKNIERHAPSSQVLEVNEPFVLQSGVALPSLQIAYQTYGTLNPNKSNAILICHALTGDQYVAETHPVTGKDGWWNTLVGQGKAVDTKKYYVICANVLGGCMGTTGPASINPETGKVYGLSFPIFTIEDMVRVQKHLIDSLKIERLLAVIGGSMGGMQSLAWASLFPNAVNGALHIATSAKHSAQNIAYHEVGRQAIMADPNWHEGRYTEFGVEPLKGLSVARMTAHITYLSERALTEKFGRKLQDRQDVSYTFEADFQVESYLRHQGLTFVDRFDANSYLYLTRAMDYFDIAADHGGQLAKAFSPNVKHSVLSFSSDWLFPTKDARTLVHALHAAGAKVSFFEIDSPRGHDAFLLEEPDLFTATRGFLEQL